MAKTFRHGRARRGQARWERACLVAACLAVACGLVALACECPALVGLVGFCVLLRRSKQRKSSGWTHGTARMAGFADLVRHRLLGEDGLILGSASLADKPSLGQALGGLFSASVDSETACRLFHAHFHKGRCSPHRLIRLQEFVHLATFAPAGRGKSVCVLVPNLLSYAKSCVVTDPKGELFTLTAEHRRRKFGHRIVHLDPFHLCEQGSDTFNPLLFIDADAEDFLDQCRDLANMLVVRSGHETDPHWCDSAEIVLTAFIAFVCACESNPAERTLNMVRDLVSSRVKYAAAIETMQQVESHNGVIQRLGHLLTWYVDKELGSVLSTVQRCTQFLDSPVVARNTGSSSFDPRCLRTGKATIYLILPGERLETLAPLMRLWVGMILRTITRGLPDDRNRVLFLIDEAAHLGKIRVLEDAVTLMRGMGIRLWFFFQSISQLQTCYGEKTSTILDNIETQQYFGINSYAVADEISKRIGDVTISVASRGDSSGHSRSDTATGGPQGSSSSGRNVNYSDTGRRLFKPEELMLLPDEMALVFHRNLPVIPALLLRYFEADEFQGGGTGAPAKPALPLGLVVAAWLLAFACAAAVVGTLGSPRAGPVHQAPAFSPDEFWRMGPLPSR